MTDKVLPPIEQVKQSITDILANHADQGKTSELLAQVSEVIDTAYGINEEIKKTLDQTQKDNENLRKANMSLFLKIGSEPVKEPQEPGKEPPKYDPASFIDAKGNLKIDKI